MTALPWRAFVMVDDLREDDVESVPLLRRQVDDVATQLVGQAASAA
jgi:hypothetical protein